MPASDAILDIEDIASRIRAGERRALARGITLIESTRKDHRTLAHRLMERLGAPGSVARRIGLSGTPGVGKSTFIEAMGLKLVEAGHRVAVLAVDPSSTVSGGSILGDKTRMEQLSRHPSAFIRPSPSDGTLGGVARRTRETIRLVEAAGFDTVLVETVGVGQSETMVVEMTDIFLLLLAPAGGDELQGVKRGIMEIADVIVVNKADGALKPVAESTRVDYAGALRLMRRGPDDPDGYPCALTCSAATGDGLDEVWQAICKLHDWRVAEGHVVEARARQGAIALHRALEQGVLKAVFADPEISRALRQAEHAVAGGHIEPEAAAAGIVSMIGGRSADG
ncbi:MAG: methylmalonyl Co-A mutase-associated GTPase MeaB [Pseudomonadota bacterium]